MSGPIPVTSSPITFPSLTRKVPDLDENEWKKIDSELLTLQSPLHHLMGMDAIQSDEAMDQYTELLTLFLSSRLEFQPEGRPYITRPQAGLRADGAGESALPAEESPSAGTGRARTLRILQENSIDFIMGAGEETSLYLPWS